MSRYLDTAQLRQAIADGHSLAGTTVLDLLTRIERYQAAELQKLATQPISAALAEALLRRILAFSQTFEAVPAEEYISSGDTEAAYDHGHAIGHNDALTALNNFLNGVRP